MLRNWPIESMTFGRCEKTSSLEMASRRDPTSEVSGLTSKVNNHIFAYQHFPYIDGLSPFTIHFLYKHHCYLHLENVKIMTLCSQSVIHYYTCICIILSSKSMASRSGCALLIIDYKQKSVYEPIITLLLWCLTVIVEKTLQMCAYGLLIITIIIIKKTQTTRCLYVCAKVKCRLVSTVFLH